MNNFFKIVFLVFVSVLAVNCTTSDDTTPSIAPEDFYTQYKKDNDSIVKFLQNHTITVDADFNVTGYPKTTNPATSIWGNNTPSHGTNVLERKLYVSGVEYIIYYLKLNQGGGERPCNVDQVYTTYSGRLVAETAAVNATSTTPFIPANAPFDYSNNPQTSFLLENVVKGWSEIFPQFNGAVATTNTDGSVTYSNPGAGIMFLPSVFAYFYSSPSDKIPAYAPLIFSFKLYGVNHLDQDGDGILSINEDVDGDYYVNGKGSADTYLDDTDGDGKPNYGDYDDDGDGYLTSYEIKRPNLLNGISNGIYPYNGATTNNPLTPDIDETQGIPDCSGNFTSVTRIRKHLDKNCH